MDSQQPVASTHHHQPTTTGANANPTASSSLTAPQIRSRVTVVCGECKRLKLKCDRRQPCASCTKRATIDRCIYSAAAAEKVDIASLNNRLIQVEAALTLLTSGQFQSTYPFANPPAAVLPLSPSALNLASFSLPPPSYNPTTSTVHAPSHQHHQRLGAHDGPTSISLSAHDLALVLLDELGLDFDSPSSADRRPSGSRSLALHPGNTNAIGSNYIKLESSPVDLELPSFPYTSFDELDLHTIASSSPRGLGEAAHLLPALSIYYPLPRLSAPSAFTPQPSSHPFSHPNNPPFPSPTTPSSAAHAYTFPPQVQLLPHPHPPPSVSPTSHPATTSTAGVPARPQITPALLALLPPRAVCEAWLYRARAVLEGLVALAPRAKGKERMDDAWTAFESRCLGVLARGGFGKAQRGAGRAGHGPHGGNGSKERKERESKQRRERKEKERREKERARMIYFGGVPALQASGSAAGEGGGGGERERSASGGSAGETTRGGGAEEGRHEQRGGFERLEEEQEEEAGEPESLAFFALLCAVLAVGASSSSLDQDQSDNPPPEPEPQDPLSPTHAPAFLFALGQQALGVWDTCATSSPSSSSRSASSSVGEREKQRTEYVLACVVGVVYLVRTGGLRADSNGEEGEEGGVEGEGSPIRSLVGKMVNAARALGLDRVLGSPSRSNASANANTREGARKGKQPAAASPTAAGRTKEDDEWRRGLWSEVLFFDLFTADVLGLAPFVSLEAYAPVPAPALRLSTTTAAMHLGPGASGDEADADADDEDSDEENGEEEEEERAALGFGDGERRDEEEGVDGDGEEGQGRAYAVARYRLTHLTALIKQRITRPAYCYGYTLEEALSLEGEVARWVEGVEEALGVSTSGPSSASPLTSAFASNKDPVQGPAGLRSPFAPFGGEQERLDREKEKENQARNPQSAELALVAGLLVLMVYKPFFLRRVPSGAKTVAAVGGQVPGPALEAGVRAAQAVVRAARDLASTKTPHFTMLDLYPLDHALFDASVICAWAAALGPARTPVSRTFRGEGALEAERERTAALVEDARLGLDLVAGLAPTGKRRRMVEKLRQRLASGAVGRKDGTGRKGKDDAGRTGKKTGTQGSTPTSGLGTKRKHDEDEDEERGGGGQRERGPGGAVNLALNPSTKTGTTNTAAEYRPSSNRAAGAGGAEGMMSGFDFGGMSMSTTSFAVPAQQQYDSLQLHQPTYPQHNHGQYLTQQQQQQQQQQHSGMVDLSARGRASTSASPPTGFGRYGEAYSECQRFEPGGSAPTHGSASAPSLASTSTSTSVVASHPHSVARLAASGPHGGGAAGQDLQERGKLDDRERKQETEREREKEKDKDKDRKHAKKTQTHPVRGIRVRDRKENRLLTPRQPSVPASGSGAGRPMASAETVLAYQQQQKKLVAPPTSVPGQGNAMGPTSASSSQAPSPAAVVREREAAAYRSRSLSLSLQPSFGQAQAQPQVSSRFGMPDVQVQLPVQQQQQQQPSPQHPHPPSFGPPSHVFEHHQPSSSYQHPHPHSQTMFDQHQPQGQFDASRSSGPMEPMGYNTVTVSSPFSNTSGPLSASSSPFASTSSGCHPSTPTSGSQHQHTPPTFGPPPPPPAPALQTNSPATYLHTPSAFAGSYASSPASSGSVHQHQHGQGMGFDMNMDQPMLSVPSTPVYEKSQQVQAAMYEAKPALESLHHHHLPPPQHQQQQMLQNHQHSHHQQDQMLHHHQGLGQNYDQEMSGSGHHHQLESGMVVSSSWSSQQQQQVSAESQPFWNTEGDFKFNY